MKAGADLGDRDAFPARSFGVFRPRIGIIAGEIADQGIAGFSRLMPPITFRVPLPARL